MINPNPDEEEETIESEENESSEEIEDLNEDGYDDSIEDENEDTESNEYESDEYDEFDVPSYIPDDLIPPEKFDTIESEADWYKNAYIGLVENNESEEFLNHVQSTYKDNLISQDKRFNELKAIDSMVSNGDPTAYLKIYAPDYVMDNGGNASFNEDERNMMIDNQLSTEFGNNYRDKFVQEEVSVPGTYSHNVIQRQTQLVEAYSQHNEMVANRMQGESMTDEERTEIIETQYQEDFEANGYTKEEYNEFVTEATEFAQEDNITFADMHKIMNFDDYLFDAFEAGRKSGRNGITEEVKHLDNSELRHRPTINKQDNNKTEFNKFGSFGNNSLIDAVKRGR